MSTTEVPTEVVRVEVIDRGPAEALAGLLGVPEPDPGDPLPLFWHWIYLLDRPPRADLGLDGHPAVNAVPAPPGPGKRRMWAGGRIRSFGGLRQGVEAIRRTAVRKQVEKVGRTGALLVTTVGHEISQGGRVVVDEEQDIVYREAATPGAAPGAAGAQAPEASAAGEETFDSPLEVDPVLLFRFSALTYNGHRIHYDREYSRDVEGYPGLVVHGPLQALMMVENIRRVSGVSPESFEYRLVSPLFDDQGFVASVTREGDGWATHVRDSSGRVTARGRV